MTHSIPPCECGGKRTIKITVLKKRSWIVKCAKCEEEFILQKTYDSDHKEKS